MTNPSFHRRRFATFAAAAGLLLATGCGDSAGTATTPEESVTNATISEAAAAESDEHGHKPGAHGGILISLGRDSYHAEAVIEQGGTLRLYMLGADESRVIDIDSQPLKGFIRGEGQTESMPIVFESSPQDGDPAGRTSQFIAQIPQPLQGGSFNVTIPNLVISGERFRLGFDSAPVSHEDEMPAKVADSEEAQLYLTSGGLYTDEDIRANGGVPASVKFKGIRSSHDMKPKVGDKICPVTKTKANPQFTWIVGGKAYEFCCPPCLDEFLKTAKTAPDEILEPGEYIKQ